MESFGPFNMANRMYLPFVLIVLAFIATTSMTTSLLASLLDAAFCSLATPSSRVGFSYSASQRCIFLILEIELLSELVDLSGLPLIILVSQLGVGRDALLWGKILTRSINHDEQMIIIENS